VISFASETIQSFGTPSLCFHLIQEAALKLFAAERGFGELLFSAVLEAPRHYPVAV
jgi:hypothetical protein